MRDAKHEPSTEAFLSGIRAKTNLRLLFGSYGSPDVYIAIILVLLLLLGQATDIAF